jgi:hypothetical protein
LILRAVVFATAVPARVPAASQPEVSPVILVQPVSQSATVGANAVFCAGVSGSEPLAYRWTKDGAPIASCTGPVLVASGVSTVNAGSYVVTVSNATGSARSQPAVLTVISAGQATPPVVGQGPFSQTIEDGATAVLSVDAEGDSARSGTGAAGSPGGADVTYQWLRDGVPVVGETEAVLVLRGASRSPAGAYRCILANSAGSVITEEAVVRVVDDPCPGHLTMMSCRTYSGTNEKRLFAGFVVGQPAMRGFLPVALRASGPSLGAKGAERALRDPVLVLKDSAGFVAANRGWAGDKPVALAAAAMGADAWDDDQSRDSALLRTLPCGAYTAEIYGDSGDTGFAVADVLDARPLSQYTRDSARLVNLSVRSAVGLGPNVPVMRFTIGGSTSVTLMIRGMGPALAALGITEVLPTPSLLLYRMNANGSQTWLQSNTRWGGKRYISEIAGKVGAFPWKSGLAADSAILLTLPPAQYLLILSGANGETGVTIMEIYEVA